MSILTISVVMLFNYRSMGATPRELVFSNAILYSDYMLLSSNDDYIYFTTLLNGSYCSIIHVISSRNYKFYKDNNISANPAE